jgi:hypothetical protein
MRRAPEGQRYPHWRGEKSDRENWHVRKSDNCGTLKKGWHTSEERRQGDHPFSLPGSATIVDSV